MKRLVAVLVVMLVSLSVVAGTYQVFDSSSSIAKQHSVVIATEPLPVQLDTLPAAGTLFVTQTDPEVVLEIIDASNPQEIKYCVYLGGTCWTAHGSSWVLLIHTVVTTEVLTQHDVERGNL